MFKFVKIAAPALIAALAAGAVPAQAAPEMHRPAPVAVQHADFVQGNQIRGDIARLDARVDQAAARHQISGREASSLRSQVRGLNQLFARYSRDGLSRYEAQTLKVRLAKANESLQASIGHDLRHDARHGDFRR